jgi:hypothetical protein
MRSYKPKALVVTALRQSSLLEVSADGKTIKRKIALQGKCALDEDFFEEDNDVAYDPRTRKPALFPVAQLPQKKVEYPPGTSKNMIKPTGFEANYVEPPVKPDEAAEEEAMYSPDKPFVERIELAIQRFKEKRRMHQGYAQVFDKLMQMGGVDSGQRIAQGLSRQEIAQMGAEERAIARATHRVPWDRADEDHWLVDFAAIIRAFLLVSTITITCYCSLSLTSTALLGSRFTLGIVQTRLRTPVKCLDHSTTICATTRSARSTTHSWRRL